MRRATEQATISLTDGFTATTDANLVSPEGVSVGRNRSWGNVLAAGAAYQLDLLTTVRGGGSWAVQRFERSELDSSDVYRANVWLDRTLTRQVRGSVGYQIWVFNIKD